MLPSPDSGNWVNQSGHQIQLNIIRGKSILQNDSRFLMISRDYVGIFQRFFQAKMHHSNASQINITTMVYKLLMIPLISSFLHLPPYIIKISYILHQQLQQQFKNVVFHHSTGTQYLNFSC